ncbi:MAG: glycosyltransferase family 4 protein [Candidatus Edwardsbacteria bacterium]
MATQKIKIIHLLHHSYSPYFDHPLKIEFRRDEWSVAVAEQIMKHFPQKYELECWRPEKLAKRIYEKKVNGIIHKIFPCRPQRHFGYSREISFPLLKELSRETKKCEQKLIIHVHGIHTYLAYAIGTLFKNIPIVGQHHGGIPKYICLRYIKKKSLYPLLYLERLWEYCSLKHFAHFFVLTKSEKEWLEGMGVSANIEIQTMGVDFELFNPMDKMEARQILNLPPKKNILLYVGKLSSFKGVDIIINIYYSLKTKYSDRFVLILIGGNRKDPLYEKATQSGAVVLGRIPQKELVPYYAAADIYLLPTFHEDYNGGIGMATVEAMACNTPVVATTLKHFPSDEWTKCGKIPETPEDVEKQIMEILENPSVFKHCREVAQIFFDWKSIIRHTVEIYERISCRIGI